MATSKSGTYQTSTATPCSVGECPREILRSLIHLSRGRLDRNLVALDQEPWTSPNVEPGAYCVDWVVENHQHGVNEIVEVERMTASPQGGHYEGEARRWKVARAPTTDLVLPFVLSLSARQDGFTLDERPGCHTNPNSTGFANRCEATVSRSGRVGFRSLRGPAYRTW